MNLVFVGGCKDEQIGAFDRPQACLIEALEIQLERAHIIRGRNAARAIGQREVFAGVVDRLNEPSLAPHPLRPAHQEIAAAQPPRIEHEIGPGQGGVPTQLQLDFVGA